MRSVLAQGFAGEGAHGQKAEAQGGGQLRCAFLRGQVFEQGVERQFGNERAPGGLRRGFAALLQQRRVGGVGQRRHVAQLFGQAALYALCRRPIGFAVCAVVGLRLPQPCLTEHGKIGRRRSIGAVAHDGHGEDFFLYAQHAVCGFAAGQAYGLRCDEAGGRVTRHQAV